MRILLSLALLSLAACGSTPRTSACTAREAINRACDVAYAATARFCDASEEPSAR